MSTNNTQSAIKLEQAIHGILCDTTIFPVGISLTYRELSKVVLSNQQLRTTFPTESPKNIRHHLSKLLEVHNNNKDNSYYSAYNHKRDISKTKGSGRYYIYTLGAIL